CGEGGFEGGVGADGVAGSDVDDGPVGWDAGDDEAGDGCGDGGCGVGAAWSADTDDRAHDGAGWGCSTRRGRVSSRVLRTRASRSARDFAPSRVRTRWRLRRIHQMATAMTAEARAPITAARVWMACQTTACTSAVPNQSWTKRRHP